MLPAQESPLSCENQAIDLEIGSQTPNPNATTAFPGVNQQQFKNFRVRGVFTLDKSMLFDNCVFLFDDDAEIITQGTVDLVGISCDFSPCGDYTWKGITIQAGGAIQLNQCALSGAETALSPRTGYRAGQSLLVNNLFQQNRYGIFVSNGATLVNFTQFYGNQFIGSFGIPGTGGELPREAVYLWGCKANIGTAVNYPPNNPAFYDGLYTNLFNGFRYGIYANTADVTVTNCSFFNMRSDALDNAPRGAGIYAFGCRSVYVTGLDDPANARVVGKCRFENCRNAGIQAALSKLHVEFAEFSGEQRRGIESRRTRFRPQTVRACTFYLKNDACLAGIGIDRTQLNSGQGPYTWLQDNYFEVDSGERLAAIEVRSPYASTDRMRIWKNRVVQTGEPEFFAGIIVYGNNADGIDLESNVVSHGGGTSNFGIFLADCMGMGHGVNNNKCTGGGSCNFHIEKARHVGYCFDTTNLAVHGFHFYGDADHTSWSQNDIGAHTRGLIIQNIPDPNDPNVFLSSGRMGPQVRKGNMWEANDNLYSEYAARCDADIIDSPFKIESLDPALFPTKVFPGINWFLPEAGPLEYCGFGEGISDFERRLAAGEVSLSPAEEWESAMLLMQLLLRRPDLLNNEPVLQHFYNQQLTTGPGQYALLERALADWSFASSQTWDSLAADYVLLDGWNVTARDANWTAGLPPLQNGAYPVSNLTLLNALNQGASVGSDLDGRLGAVEQAYATHTQQILTILAGLPEAQPYEQGWKTLKNYQIRHNLDQEPAQAGYADVLALAEADPALYGAAVRHARHARHGADYFVWMDPRENTGSEREGRPDKAPYDRTGITIAPNPSNNAVTINAAQPLGAWWLTNHIGQVVRNGYSEQTSLRIEVEGLATGVYFFRVQDDDPRLIIVTSK